MGLLKKADLDVALGISRARGEDLVRDELITFTKVSDQLAVSTKTVSRMLNSGELVGKRLRHYYRLSMSIFQSSVDEVLCR